ncbi:primosomal protein N' [Paracoccaceae bacterium GXU_MW_L88]
MREFAQGTPISVLTTQPIGRPLDYLAPEGGASRGDYVHVPLGPRKVIGVVEGPGAGGYAGKLRAAFGRLDLPPMSGEMREFLARAGEYTLTPPDIMLRLATRAPGIGDPPPVQTAYVLGDDTPPRMTAARERVLAICEEYEGTPLSAGDLSSLAGVSSGVIKGLADAGALIQVDLPRDAPFPRLDFARPGNALSDAQADAATALRARVAARSYSTTLLKGVTGSGKTEVYLEAVAEALKQNRQALILLPEIALTTQFISRLEARFGARPAEWHSGVTQAGRRRVWTGVARGEAQVVVGARSALFLPFQNLGLVVVDEEHDGSYKQEEGALYNARDMAVLRASLAGASVVLASATPALETWVNARSGKYHRLDLADRFGAAILPEIKALDLRDTPPEQGRWISPPLEAEIKARLETGEQSLLFLNRRGYAPLTLCRACGSQVACEDCDAKMVEHRFHNRLICHQCGAQRAIPEACPSCEVEGKMVALGPGVERIAEEVAAVFPEARVAVLSSDMGLTARALKEQIETIAAGGADIIIGTQIVAKGHNFPKLTLVGVIDADLGLQGGDLRASEKTFQLIRQVTGRAGRADKAGLALLQSYQPDHPVMQAIMSGDEEAFWEAEAAAREVSGAPPFGRMAGIIISGPEVAPCFELGHALVREGQPLFAIGAQIFGPAPAPIARIRGRHRVRLLVKAPRGAPLQNALKAWRDRVQLPKNTRLAIDIDPQTFF